MSVFLNAQSFNFSEHEEHRESFIWGSYGKKQEEELQTNKLKNLSTNHIYNILRTQLLEREVYEGFVMELCYRVGHKEKS